MKYDVKVDTTLKSILTTKKKWEPSFEIPVSEHDVKSTLEYLTNVGQVDGLARFLYDVSNQTDAYITFDIEYDNTCNVFYANVLFDNNNIGLGLIISDDTTITVINTMEKP